MISNDKFMEQFKALEYSEDFKEALNWRPPVSNQKPIHDDARFTEGIRLFGEWLRKTYGINKDKNGI